MVSCQLSVFTSYRILKTGDHGRCTTGRLSGQFTDRPYVLFVNGSGLRPVMLDLLAFIHRPTLL